jgi:Uma2 family endonuclease
MSTIIPSLPQTTVALPPVNSQTRRADVVVEGKITIPGWIDSLESYRRWAESDEYPLNGWISYLDGTIWVDPSMEEFLTHNRVKQAYNGLFFSLLAQHPVGCFVPDRMLLVNEAANLSTEPDGLFYLWTTMQAGRLNLVRGKKAGYMQLEGTPDAVLEIVSESSETKDLVHLRDLYWKARIPEYWLVDVRRDEARFDILRHTNDAYQPTPSDQGWLRSEIVGHSFRIERTTDPLGFPQYVVQVKA